MYLFIVVDKNDERTNRTEWRLMSCAHTCKLTESYTKIGLTHMYGQAHSIADLQIFQTAVAGGQNRPHAKGHAWAFGRFQMIKIPV